MTKEDLLIEISIILTRRKANKLAGLAENNPGFIKVVLDLAFYPKKEIAFRAAWILENVYFKNTSGLNIFLNEFIDAYCLQKKPELSKTFH